MYKMDLRPDQVWAFALENFDRLNKERVVIAHGDQGIEACLTVYEDEVYAIVYYGERPLYSEKIMNNEDAEMVVTKIYIDYLGIPEDDANPVDESESEEMTDEELHQELEDAVYEREDGLLMASVAFLTEVLCIDDEENDAETVIRNDYEINIEEFIDAVLEMIASKFLTSVYRPTFIPDEDAPLGEIINEFPYEEIVQAALLEEKKKKGDNKKE